MESSNDESFIGPTMFYKCRICMDNKLFDSKEDLANHVKSEVHKFTCKICMDGKVFKSIKNLREHYRSRIHRSKILCHICFDQFNTSDQRKEHLSQMHPRVFENHEKNTICQTCGMVCKTSSSLVTHIYILHRSEAAYICGKCNKINESYEDLNLHLDISHPNATAATDFSCDFCGRQCFGKKKLSRHKTTHANGPKLNKFHCCNCYMVFCTQSIGERHVTGHGAGSKLAEGQVCRREMDNIVFTSPQELVKKEPNDDEGDHEGNINIGQKKGVDDNLENVNVEQRNSADGGDHEKHINFGQGKGIDGSDRIENVNVYHRNVDVVSYNCSNNESNQGQSVMINRENCDNTADTTGGSRKRKRNPSSAELIEYQKLVMSSTKAVLSNILTEEEIEEVLEETNCKIMEIVLRKKK